jgi:hypothetical protein
VGRNALIDDGEYLLFYLVEQGVNFCMIVVTLRDGFRAKRERNRDLAEARV